ncbi:alpha-ribazole phosphatase [Pseudoalteromonas sp. A25]|uniref:histidine phosphatase family protein n=1 Tax=Pseudoalteromonas sp. A25 TaxID=116092 RepID=UPI0012607F15|nr:histidine phosphatase family protein [Pseudoalteromonas sp. A25]BBN80705.1 alpha-ribazole phosphatase [Pseudoalteromonas sp. A25]
MEQVWYFIRHGTPQVTGCLLGATDVPLSDLGWQQLSEAVAHFKNIDNVVSSPLKRCKAFAEHMCAHRNASLKVDAQLQEMNFGDWDGQPYELLWQQTSTPTIGQFWQSPNIYAPPNGESLQQFQTRIIQWWTKQLGNNRCRSNMVFTHAGVIKQLIGHILCLESSNMQAFNALDIGYGKVVSVHVYYDEQDKAWPKVVF